MVGLGLLREALFHGANPWGNEVSAIMVSSSAEHVAIDDARFVDVDATTDF